MKSINSYLNDVAALTRTGSDYAVAKELGIAAQSLNGYRRRGVVPDDDVCLVIAERLGIDPIEVIAAANAARAAKREDAVIAEKWRRVWKRAAGVTAAVIFSASVIPNYAVDSKASSTFANSRAIDYTQL